MPAHAVFIVEFLIVYGRIFPKIKHIQISEILRQFPQKFGVLFVIFILRPFRKSRFPRHRHHENFALRLNFPHFLYNLAIIPRKSFLVIFFVFEIYIRHRAEPAFVSFKMTHIVHAQRNDIRLRRQSHVPKPRLLRKTIAIFFRRHSPARKIIHRRADVARHILPPRILEIIVPAHNAFLVQRFELARRKTIPDTRNRAKNSAKSAADRHFIERFFPFPYIQKLIDIHIFTFRFTSAHA